MTNVPEFGGLTIEDVSKMDLLKLCTLWRFAPVGFWRDGEPVSEYAARRMAELGGMTPAISKQIGW